MNSDSNIISQIRRENILVKIEENKRISSLVASKN